MENDIFEIQAYFILIYMVYLALLGITRGFKRLIRIR